jgi:uncharacterized protein (DUF433 family)
MTLEILKEQVYGRGAYPIRVAARLAKLDTQTARRWVDGYEYDYLGERRWSPPISYLAKSQSPDGGQLLDFEQLLTLLLVQAFKSRGLGLPTIKRAAAKARMVYGSPNPFVTKYFRSDGNHVFIDLEATGPERELINVLSDQREFRDIVEPSLFRDVVFFGDEAGEWWPLGRDHRVVLAPDRQFGAPIIAGRGVRTEVVAHAVAAEGGGDAGVKAVADWYDLDLAQVRDAVEFEGAWQSKRAA